MNIIIFFIRQMIDKLRLQNYIKNSSITKDIQQTILFYQKIPHMPSKHVGKK